VVPLPLPHVLKKSSRLNRWNCFLDLAVETAKNRLRCGEPVFKNRTTNPDCEAWALMTTQNRMPSLGPRHVSRCLPAFFAAAHLFLMADASRLRPSSLSLPRRGRDEAAAFFDAPA